MCREPHAVMLFLTAGVGVVNVAVGHMICKSQSIISISIGLYAIVNPNRTPAYLIGTMQLEISRRSVSPAAPCGQLIRIWHFHPTTTIAYNVRARTSRRV